MPIMVALTYKKLMFYHNIVNSDDNRIVKALVREQERSGNKECWVGNIIEEAGSLDIEVSQETVRGKPKSTWKKEVKSKIRVAVERELEEKKKEYKKLRFLKKKGYDTYLKEIHNEKARNGIKIRLNMVEWIADNMGSRSRCPLCGEDSDTTEHVFRCIVVENDLLLTVKDLEDGVKMGEIVELFKRNEEARREKMKEDIFLNFDILRREGTL